MNGRTPNASEHRFLTRRVCFLEVFILWLKDVSFLLCDNKLRAAGSAGEPTVKCPRAMPQPCRALAAGTERAPGVGRPWTTEEASLSSGRSQCHEIDNNITQRAFVF